MNGYSRIKADSNSSIPKLSTVKSYEHSVPTTVVILKSQSHDKSLPKLKKGASFSERLSRDCSSISERFRSVDKGSSGSTDLQAGLRRAFTMKRAPSSSDGYCRIHDTGDEEIEKEQMGRSKKKSGKIIRACRRLFGL